MTKRTGNGRRNVLGSFVVTALVIAASSCSRTAPPIDLVAALPSAERRARASVDTAIRATAIVRDGADRPALVTEAPARVLYPVTFPARARFHADVALAPSSGAGITVRVGISDDRSYDELYRATLDPSPAGGDVWHPIDIDLKEYSGWAFSLFYQPWRRHWHLVLNADATPGGRAIWLEPSVTMGR
jgi:hypothetical protein